MVLFESGGFAEGVLQLGMLVVLAIKEAMCVEAICIASHLVSGD